MSDTTDVPTVPITKEQVASAPPAAVAAPAVPAKKPISEVKRKSLEKARFQKKVKSEVRKQSATQQPANEQESESSEEDEPPAPKRYKPATTYRLVPERGSLSIGTIAAVSALAVGGFMLAYNNKEYLVATLSKPNPMSSQHEAPVQRDQDLLNNLKPFKFNL